MVCLCAAHAAKCGSSVFIAATRVQWCWHDPNVLTVLTAHVSRVFSRLHSSRLFSAGIFTLFSDQDRRGEPHCSWSRKREGHQKVLAEIATGWRVTKMAGGMDGVYIYIYFFFALRPSEAVWVGFLHVCGPEKTKRRVERTGLVEVGLQLGCQQGLCLKRGWDCRCLPGGIRDCS